MQDIRIGYDEEGNLDKSRTDDPYRFDLDQNGFPAFTDKNLRLVWAMVENDSDYNPEDEKTVTKAYRDALNCDDDAIEQAVNFTDNVNSTRLAAFSPKAMSNIKANSENAEFNQVQNGYGRFMTVSEMMSNKDNLMNLTKSGDAQAVFDIARYSEQYARHKLKIEDINKNNFSFATKFCHYACLKGLGKDLYCIYDKVVYEVLPYYIYKYSDTDLPGKSNRCKNEYNALKNYLDKCRTCDTPNGYQRFRNCYDGVIKGIEGWREANGETGSKVPGIDENGKLSYQHVDKLIWYYFKGPRLLKANKRSETLIK